MSKSRSTILIILAFIAIYVIWGSTYLLNKIAVTELPPMMLASIRFLSASILIFIIAKLIGIELRISLKQLRNTAIAGFLFLTYGNGVVVWALKYVDSGFTALEISAQPLVVLLLMRILEGKKFELMSIVGVVLGFIGIFLLVSQKELISQEGMALGMLMIFTCMVSWGYGSLFVAKADLPSNFFVNTGYQMLTGGIMLLITSLLLGEVWTLPTQWSRPVQLSMILLIVFGGIVAFTAFNYLLKTVSPEKVATSTYVNPIIALILGWYFLNEQITVQSVVAAIVLLTGVYFINTKKKMVLYSRFRKLLNVKIKSRKMFTVIIVMLLGMCVGYLLRERQKLAKHIDTIVTWAIFLLLFLLGVSVGTNKTILNNIDSIFLSVVILTLGAVLGSVFIAYFTYRYFFRKYED